MNLVLDMKQRNLWYHFPEFNENNYVPLKQVRLPSLKECSLCGNQ